MPLVHCLSLVLENWSVFIFREKRGSRVRQERCQKGRTQQILHLLIPSENGQRSVLRNMVFSLRPWRTGHLSQMHSLQNTSKLHLTCTMFFIDERNWRGTRSWEAQMMRLWTVLLAKQNKVCLWRFQFAFCRKLNLIWNWAKMLR